MAEASHIRARGTVVDSTRQPVPAHASGSRHRRHGDHYGSTGHFELPPHVPGHVCRSCFRQRTRSLGIVHGRFLCSEHEPATAISDGADYHSRSATLASICPTLNVAQSKERASSSPRRRRRRRASAERHDRCRARSARRIAVANRWCATSHHSRAPTNTASSSLCGTVPRLRR